MSDRSSHLFGLHIFIYLCNLNLCDLNLGELGIFKRNLFYQRWCTDARIFVSYTRRIAAIAPSLSGGRSLAAQLSRTCEGRLPPGMAQVTASCIRIQRSANCAILTPAGSSPRISSTAGVSMAQFAL